MEAMRSVSLLLLVVAGLVSLSQAYDFYVGGRDGWVLNPSENLNQWAERNRFQVNDKLVFKYKKGEDSVLLVNKEDYDSCNRSNPIRNMGDGVSVVLLDRSGPFFFISGSPGNCEKGQKLIVVVLADRGKHPAPAPKTPINPPSASPVPSPQPPVSPVLPPVTPPSASPAPSPKPVVTPPSASPAPSPKHFATPPSSASPAPSPKPFVTPPSATPSSSPPKSPFTPSPAPSSTHKSPSPSPAPSSTHKSPSPSPASSKPIGQSPSPAPSPAKSSSAILTVSTRLLVALAVVVVSLC